jgi:chemotaxis protein histidine kinase CheA
MAKPFDSSAFLGAFKAEAEEYVGKLTTGLLALEKDPDQPETIEELFRVAHTLKGVARMMGFLDVQQIAHEIEEDFGKIREKKIKFTSQIADKSLAALDKISAALAKNASSEPAPAAEKPQPKPLEPKAPPPAQKPKPQKNGGNIPEPVAKPSEPEPVARGDEYIRIPISRINTLFNLVGELVIHKVKSSYKLTSLRQLTQQIKTSQKRLAQWGDQADTHGLSSLLHQHNLDTENLKKQIVSLADLLASEAMHLDPVIDELQYKVKELRMLPCATIFSGIERLVRDIAHQERKEIELVVQGEDTELDKKLLEAIKPCLVHLLRNAVDHGIELPAEREDHGKPPTGTIWLKASQQSGKAIIEVRDDGNGIDLDRVKQVALEMQIATGEELNHMDEQELMNLVFEPGFSTSSIITDVSGRGVGMDVVRREVENLKGHVDVASTLGRGTTVTIELPLTVAIMEVLLVEANGQRFGLPTLGIAEIVRVKPSQIQTMNHRMAMVLRDRTLPVVRLSEVLALPAKSADEEAADKTAEEWPVVIAGIAERRIGLLVDRVLSEEEIFIKSLGTHLGTLKNVNGAAILGTGEVIVILDVHDLIVSARQTGTISEPRLVTQEKPKKRRILIAEDSLTTREFERSLLEAQGYDVETAVDGLDALEKVSRADFHLVVSDIQMPRMNGFEFCRNVRQQPEHKELPFVFVTTLDKDEEKRKGIEVGAQAYIVKGAFNQENLLQTIERLIG